MLYYLQLLLLTPLYSLMSILLWRDQEREILLLRQQLLILHRQLGRKPTYIPSGEAGLVAGGLASLEAAPGHGPLDRATRHIAPLAPRARAATGLRHAPGPLQSLNEEEAQSGKPLGDAAQGQLSLAEQMGLVLADVLGTQPVRRAVKVAGKIIAQRPPHERLRSIPFEDPNAVSGDLNVMGQLVRFDYYAAKWFRVAPTTPVATFMNARFSVPILQILSNVNAVRRYWGERLPLEVMRSFRG